MIFRGCTKRDSDPNGDCHEESNGSSVQVRSPSVVDDRFETTNILLREVWIQDRSPLAMQVVIFCSKTGCGGIDDVDGCLVPFPPLFRILSVKNVDEV